MKKTNDESSGLDVVVKTIASLRAKAEALERGEDVDAEKANFGEVLGRVGSGLARGVGQLASSAVNKLMGRKPPYTVWYFGTKNGGADGGEIKYIPLGKLEVSDKTLQSIGLLLSNAEKRDTLILVSKSDSEQDHYVNNKFIEDNDAYKIIKAGGDVKVLTKHKYGEEDEENKGDAVGV